MSLYIPTFSEILNVSRGRGSGSEAPALWNGLVGNWPLQEGGGATAYDMSGYGQDPTWNGAGTRWDVESVGRCALFVDGSGDYLHDASAGGPLLITGDFTIAVWGEIDDAGWHAAIEVGAVSTARYGLWVYGGRLYCTTDGTYGSSYKAGVATNTWQHWAVAYRAGDQAKDYWIDGAWQGETTSESDVPSPTGELHIGSSSTEQYMWDGHLQLAHIWNRALAPSEIQQLYADPWAMYTLRPRVLAAAAGGASYTLTAGTGAFTLSGQAAALKHARTLPGSTGAFALTGKPALLRADRTLPAAAGSLALTGQAAGLQKGRTLAADVGSFAITGKAAALKVARLLAAGTGVFSISGKAADLEYSGGEALVVPPAVAAAQVASVGPMAGQIHSAPVAAGQLYAAGAAAGQIALSG